MIYEFRCPVCGTEKEVYRHHTECAKEEICGNPLSDYDVCNMVMTRVFSVPQVAVSSLGYYDTGLGAYIGNKRDLANAKAKIRGESGVDVVEVGNDKPKCSPVMKDYDIPRGIFDDSIKD
jgi:predicted nucleic acid-binding Zn ribbon protein